MPDRVINPRSATGCLLVLLPAALAMSALFVAWPFILGGTLLLVGGNVWQSYEWSKTAQSIDPVFQQLIVKNRGEITPIDLSLTGNISSGVAKKYLAAKADEFGTGSREYPDRGQVYYFISVSTLGAIFDDSESDISIPEIAAATTPVVALPQAQELPMATPDPVPISPAPVVVQPVAELTNLHQLFEEEPTPTPVVANAPSSDHPAVTIIQSELAKRLDVHSSTIYKRRSEPDFTDWTRNRDPEGLGWAYADASKEYYRVDV